MRCSFRLLICQLYTIGILAGASSEDGIRFTDVASKSGLVFTHFNGARGQFYFPEIMGAGVAFLDYDGDGFQDVFVVNGSSLPGPDAAKDPTSRLFRNRGNGTFTDVTAVTGLLEVKGIFGTGVGVGDYDNDGDTDLYLTGYRRSVLWRNKGDGTFTDSTAAAGVENQRHWAASSGFFDYDRDGDLDLLVANYVRFDTQQNTVCRQGGERSYCHPSTFQSDSSVLYRNNGDATFTDVSQDSGIGKVAGKALGVVFADYDGDGWDDVFVACDTTPDLLFKNNQDGTFSEDGLLAGVAYDHNGHARAGMGVDFGDYDGDGLLDLVVTNFSMEGNALFRNLGDGSFSEETYTTGILDNSLLNVGFGVGFLDIDNDSDLDVFSANGHVIHNIERYRDDTTFAQRMLLYENNRGHYREISSRSGECFERLDVGRGAAFADFDNDGDVDILVSNNGSRLRLLRNEGGNRGNWLSLKLVGQKSNREGIGARVRARVGEQWLHRQVRRAGSYLSSNDVRLHLGLGQARQVDEVEIAWPSGAIQKLKDLESNQFLVVEEEP